MPEPHAHYGQSYYGVPYYGAGGGQWVLLVDWDADGAWDYNEGNYLINVTTDRGRAQMLDSGGLAPQAVGQATLILDNKDNRYTPWYTGSPIYPNSLPRRLALLQFVDTDGTTYDIIKGYFSANSPQLIDFVKPRVKFILEDGWRLLEEADDVSYPLTFNVDTGAAIGHVLDEAGWPGELARNLDTGIDTLIDWWLAGKARAAIESLNNSEWGQVYCATDGRFTFHNRHYHINRASDASVSQNVIRRDAIVLGSANDTVKNQVTVQVHPVVLAARGTLWTMGGVTQIDASSSVTLTADYSYNGIGCPATSVETPVANVDYFINAQADGTGPDKSGLVTLSVVLDSNHAELTFTNADTQPVYITSLVVNGVAITQPNTQPISMSDTTSIAAYGKRVLSLDLEWQQSAFAAEDFATFLRDWLKDPTYPPRIILEHQPTIGFAWDLFDRIKITMNAIGLVKLYRLGRIQHRWKGEGQPQAYETEWAMEPVNLNLDYWQLDVSGLDVDTRLAY